MAKLTKYIVFSFTFRPLLYLRKSKDAGGVYPGEQLTPNITEDAAEMPEVVNDIKSRITLD